MSRALLCCGRPLGESARDGRLLEGDRNLICCGGHRLALVGMLLCGALAACTPKVQVEAPKEPITINLNVKLDAEVRVKIEEQADKDIKDNPDIF